MDHRFDLRAGYRPGAIVPAFLLHAILSALQVRKAPGIQSALIET